MLTPVENPSALLRPHEILIDVLSVLHGLADGLLGDLVEDDSLDRYFRFENFLEVPADRLPFAIGVGCQVDLSGAFQRGLQRLNMLALVVGNDVIGLEVAVGIDAESSPLFFADLVGNFVGRLGQIADVAVTRQHLVSAFQNAFDRSGLCWRLDDHECLCHGVRNYVPPRFRSIFTNRLRRTGPTHIPGH